jgi:hypothetical protein
MIANPEVADVFRKRAKVGHHPNFICLRKSFLLVLFLILIFFIVYCKFRNFILSAYFSVSMPLNWVRTIIKLSSFALFSYCV